MNKMPYTDDEPKLEDRAGNLMIAVVRIAVGLLWLQNVGWKRPPDFGEAKGVGLYAFTKDGVEHEVFAPFAWFVREIVLPNFRLFGWGVLIVEGCLGAFLLIGLLTRFWSVIGVFQSVAIALSVLNTPNEWSWSYYMMIALHLALFSLCAGRVAGVDGIMRPWWREKNRFVHRVLLRLS